jgi:hypothetical protein
MKRVILLLTAWLICRAACAEHLGSWKIDDVITFHAQTTSAAGAVTDADSAPTYRIYEDETGTPIVTGTMALLDSSNTDGWYSEQITLSAANGFEKGKSYAIRMLAPVGGVSSATYHTFQIGAASDVIHIAGSATPVTQLAEAFDNDGTGGDFDLSSLSVTGGATIANSSGNALTLTAGGSAGIALDAAGAGFGPGARIRSGSGSAATALEVTSLATNGTALALTGAGSGHGMLLDGGATGDDLALAADDAPDLITALFSQVSGTADSGSTTTLVDAGLTQADTDYWKGSWLLITSGNIVGQVRQISAFNPTNDTITVDRPFTQPIATHSFMILSTGGGDANVTQWAGKPVAAPAVDGVPEVDITHVLGDPVCD